MGYILKTTFWLGLVYSAMPLGEPFKMAALPDASMCAAAAQAVVANLGPASEPYRAAAASSCVAVVAARAASAPGSPSVFLKPAAPAVRQASAQSLTDRDRQAPWIGPVRPAPRGKGNPQAS